MPELHVEGTGWEHEHELALLDEDLALIGDQRRSDETKKMVNAIEVCPQLTSAAISQEAVAGASRSCPGQAFTQDVGRCAGQVPGRQEVWREDVLGEGEE